MDNYLIVTVDIVRNSVEMLSINFVHDLPSAINNIYDTLSTVFDMRHPDIQDMDLVDALYLYNCGTMSERFRQKLICIPKYALPDDDNRLSKVIYWNNNRLVYWIELNDIYGQVDAYC